MSQIKSRSTLRYFAIIGLCVFIGLIALFAITYLNATATDYTHTSLVRFYNMTGDGATTMKDLNATPHDASLQTGGTSTLYTNTSHGNLRHFNGLTSYASNCYMPENLGIGYTYEIMVSDINYSVINGIFGQGASGKHSLLINDTGWLLWGLNHTATLSELIAIKLDTSRQSQHIICSYDDVSNAVNVWINGNNNYSGTESATGAYYSSVCVIGRLGSQNTNLTGNVSFIRFYNRGINATEAAANTENEAWRFAAEPEPTPTPAPVASFTGTPTTGAAPLTVTFDSSTSTGTITDYAWSWGDLTANGTTDSPSHQYTETGAYTVILTVTGPGGSDSELKTEYITVTEAPTPTPAPGSFYINNTWHRVSGPVGKNGNAGQFLFNGHAHTNESDGVISPSNLQTGYANNFTDANAITDHDKLTADPGVEGILYMPGVEEAVGFYYGSGSTYMCHLNALNVSSQSTSGSVNVTLASIRSQGGLPQYNHADESGNDWNTSELQGVARNYELIEIYNGGQGEVNAHGTIDNLLSNGTRLRLTANDDIHYWSGLHKGWNIINAPELTVPALTNALTLGNFYASTGAVIEDIVTVGNNITITIPDSSTVQWIIHNGTIIETDTATTSASYTANGTETYIRARITRVNDSKMAWTQAMYIEPTGIPDANFTSNVTTGTVPLTVQFNDTSIGNVTGWQWDFGDVTFGSSNSTEQNPTHIYESAGTFNVTLTVSNDTFSSVLVKNAYIEVQEATITANFTANTTIGYNPLTVQFTDTSTGLINHRNWYIKNSTEAEYGQTSGSDAIQNITFTEPGTYDVKLSIAYTDKDIDLFDTEEKIGYITVSSEPVASFTSDKTSGYAPLTVQFTDTSTGLINTRHWSAKLSTDQVYGFPFGSDEVQTYTFTEPGIYDVKLSIAYLDKGIDKNDSEEKTGYITVNVAPTPTPTPIPAPIIADFTGTPLSGNAPLSVSFSQSSTGIIENYYWDFGDGYHSSEANPKHKYNKEGTFTVVFSVSNPGGADSMTKSSMITVGHAPMPTTGTYINNITGGTAAKNRTVTLFNDGGIEGIINSLFPNNTDDVHPEQVLGYIGRPFTMAMGNWWIVIVIGVIGFGMILSQGGNPMLTGLTLMFGNVVLWVFLPFDWLGAIVSLVIFSISVVVYAGITKK